MYGGHKRGSVVPLPTIIAENNSKRIKLVNNNNRLPSSSNNNCARLLSTSSNVTSLADASVQLNLEATSSGNELKTVFIPINLKFQPKSRSGSLFAGKIAVQNTLSKHHSPQLKLVTPKVVQLPAKRIALINENLVIENEQEIPQQLEISASNQTVSVQSNTECESLAAALMVRPLQKLRIVSAVDSNLQQQSKVTCEAIQLRKQQQINVYFDQNLLDPPKEEFLSRCLSSSPTDIKEELLHVNDLNNDEVSLPPEAIHAEIPKIKCKMCPKFVKETSCSESCEDCTERLKKVETVFKNVAKVKTVPSLHIRPQPILRQIPLRPVLKTYSAHTKSNVTKYNKKESKSTKLEIKLLYKLALVRFKETPNSLVSQEEIEQWMTSKSNLGNFRIFGFKEKVGAALAELVDNSEIIVCHDSNNTACYKLHNLSKPDQSKSKDSKVVSEIVTKSTAMKSPTGLSTATKEVPVSNKNLHNKNIKTGILKIQSGVNPTGEQFFTSINNIAKNKGKCKVATSSQVSLTESQPKDTVFKSKQNLNDSIDLVTISSSDSESETEAKQSKARSNKTSETINKQTSQIQIQSKNKKSKNSKKYKLNLVLVANRKTNPLPSVRMSPSFSQSLPKPKDTPSSSNLSWITNAAPSTSFRVSDPFKRCMSQLKLAAKPYTQVTEITDEPVRMSPSLSAVTPKSKKTELQPKTVNLGPSSTPATAEKRSKQKQQEKNNSLTLPSPQIRTSVAVFKCPYCFKPFFEYSGLDCHLHRFHKGTLPYKCKDCKKRFPYWKMFLIHRKIHKVSLDLICGDCGVNFGRDEPKYCGHVKLHGESMFQCKFCTSQFSASKYLDLHFITVHQDLAPLTCNENNCQMSFMSFDGYCNHMEVIHTIDNCNRGILSAGSKPPFIESNFSFCLYTDVQMNLTCDICSASVCTVDNLQRHMTEVHEYDQSTKCDHCDKMFSCDFFPRHLAICHSDENRWTWNSCLESFVPMEKARETGTEDEEEILSVEQEEEVLTAEQEEEVLNVEQEDEVLIVEQELAKDHSCSADPSLPSQMSAKNKELLSNDSSIRPRDKMAENFILKHKHNDTQMEPQTSIENKTVLRTYTNKKKGSRNPVEVKKLPQNLKSPESSELQFQAKNSSFKNQNESWKLRPPHSSIVPSVRRAMNIHQKVLDPKNPYPCAHPNCDKRFSQQHFAFLHYRIVHQELQKYIERKEQQLSDCSRERSLTQSKFVSEKNRQNKKFVIMKRIKNQNQTKTQIQNQSALQKTIDGRDDFGNTKKKNADILDLKWTSWSDCSAEPGTVATKAECVVTKKTGSFEGEKNQVILPMSANTEAEAKIPIPFTNDESGRREFEKLEKLPDISEEHEIELEDFSEICSLNLLTATEEEIETAIKEVYFANQVEALQADEN